MDQAISNSSKEKFPAMETAQGAALTWGPSSRHLQKGRASMGLPQEGVMNLRVTAAPCRGQIIGTSQ